MRRQCLSLFACLLLHAGLSGCCLFCPWHCGAGGCYDKPYSGGSYGACVLPGGCPECATGIYAAQLNPVHRARAVRLERMRRQRYAYGRMPRQRHPQYGQHGGYGYGGYGDMLPDDPYAYGGDMPYGEMPYGDMAMGYGDDMFFDDGSGMGAEFMGLDGGWTESSPCNCQDGMSYSGELMDGGWIEGTPTPMTPATPANLAPQAVPMGEPQAMPREEVVPDPVPVTREQYYFPAPQLPPSSISGGDTNSGTTVEAGPAGSPIQPVLWVPGGL